MSAAAVWLAIALFGCSAAADAQRQPTASPAEASPTASVRIIDGVTLRDVSRQRDIPIKIYEPALASAREALNAPGSALPLIIFSHGYGSNKEGYAYLAQGWARAGYVVLRTDQGGDRAALQAKGVRAIRNGLAVSADRLLNNAHDVSFILVVGQVASEALAPAHSRACCLSRKCRI